MRNLAVLVLLVASCKQDAEKPQTAEQACIEQAQKSLAICLDVTNSPTPAFRCGAAFEAKAHVCRRVYNKNYDPTNIEWSDGSSYTWVGDETIPQSWIPCPEDLYGKGWVKLQREMSHGSICLRNDQTGEVF